MVELDKADLGKSQSDHRLPRIGIIDLMILTAAMALVFSLREKMNAIGWNFQTEVFWFKAVEHVCFCLTYGLPVAAIYRLIIQKKHTGRFFIEPGHWMLFSTLLMVIASTVPVFALSNVDRFLEESNVAWYCLPYMVSSLIASWLLFRGSFVVGKWWKSILALIAIKELAMAFQQFAFYRMISSNNFLWSGDSWISLFSSSLAWLEFALQIVICVCLTLLIIKELRKGPARDLWHWIGVLMPFMLYFVYTILGWIYSNYLFEPSLL